jgi:hypothetical protein
MRTDGGGGSLAAIRYSPSSAPLTTAFVGIDDRSKRTRARFSSRNSSRLTTKSAAPP